jgi:stage II sporulation protein D
MGSARAMSRRRLTNARGIPLVTALAVSIAMCTVVSAAPARAAGCFPAGGESMQKPSAAPGDFVFSGHGWGHGIGMSQYGARGAAQLGCSVTDILSTYYPGVAVQTADMPDRLRVGIVPNRPSGALVKSYRVKVTTGSSTWTLQATESGTGRTTSSTARQPAGATWQVETLGDGGVQLRDLGVDVPEHLAGTDEDPGVVLAADAVSTLTAQVDGATVELPREGHRYRRGRLEFVPRVRSGAADGMFVTLVVAGSGGTSAMDAYLYGLAEMPSSWPAAALQAQAVVGRSFALTQWLAYRGNRTDCRCDLFDSTSSQHYTGYDKEGEGSYGARWVAAVDATSGKVIASGGRVVSGYYNSSHGGHSESNAFVWGGSALSYLGAVDDSRWDRASGNPYGTWTMSFTAAEVSAKLAAAGFDVGDVRAVRLPKPLGSSGRVGDPARGAGGAVIDGSRRTITISGNALRTALGLRSTLVTVSSRPLACVPPAGVEVAGLRPARLAGDDRVATAVAVSKAEWSTAPTAVLAAADDFPDALAGGPLAAELDAPLLLTTPGALSPAVATELRRLGVDRVVLLGGEQAISGRVADALADLGIADVTRLAGDDRWETAAEIAETVGPSAASEVILTLGGHAEAARAWPDAVAAGAIQGGSDPVPHLLTMPTSLPPATRAALVALRDGGARRVLLVGGPAAVDTNVEGEVESLGLEVERIAGSNRYGTSAEVADAAIARGASAQAAIAVTAANFPDALSAAGLAARNRVPLLLVDACDLAARPVTTEWLDGQGELATVKLVGGVNALSDQVRWQFDQRMR